MSIQSLPAAPPSYTNSINPTPLARHEPVIEELTKYLTIHIQFYHPETCESPHVQSDQKRLSARFLQRPLAHLISSYTHNDHTSKPACIPYQVLPLHRYHNNRRCICRIPEDRKQKKTRREPFASSLHVFNCRLSNTRLLSGCCTHIFVAPEPRLEHV